MRKYNTLGKKLPYYFFKYLFGDRKKYGKEVNKHDSDWILWEKTYNEFYTENQKKSIGNFVNKAGYKIMGDINLKSKDILELGPGKISHHKYWKSSPKNYNIADIYQMFLDQNNDLFLKSEINLIKHLIVDSVELPFPDNSFDVIISFYQLEHLNPLDEYLEEYKRVLNKKGVFVGAIPAEGGIGWGLGRFFTTRRWFKAKTKINPDKIICWEHPNFADEILNKLKDVFKVEKFDFWPLKFKSIDFNLVISFKLIKK